MHPMGFVQRYGERVRRLVGNVIGRHSNTDRCGTANFIICSVRGCSEAVQKKRFLVLEIGKLELTVRIVVLAKQVPDPETPPSQFKVDESTNSVIPPTGVPPVVNGFDLNAVEAALKLRDAGADVEITLLSVGTGFVMDAMKKPLAMGADRLVLVDEPELDKLDSAATVRVLAAAIEKDGPFDLILGGRQASDWDQAHVTIGLAEVLDLPLVSLVQKLEMNGDTVQLQRVIPDGYQVITAPIPSVLTITNEIGEPRYPNLRGIMQASRKQPEIFSLADIGLSTDDLAPKVQLRRLYVPESNRQVELIEGDDEADAGRKLALRLREEKLI
ncbi:MAG: electron transfer flavoprotein subunit beta/FixA family protein [Chloroflexi bacterium]|nr:MAG: electron transfer flavoprotein subunit beta/FixA family protein [Chloroflexota bacterium]